MPRCYVSDHSENWDEYAEPFTHAYNQNVHRAIDTRPLDLVRSRSPPEFSLHYDDDAPPQTGKERTDFLEHLQKAIEKASTSLGKAQRCYKSYFDKRFRKALDRPTVGGWIFLNRSDAFYKPIGDDGSKHPHVNEGPYKVLELSARISVIQRGPLVERVTVDHITSASPPVD